MLFDIFKKQKEENKQLMNGESYGFQKTKIKEGK